mmetsp:Transcript_15305/g.44255  ORF Transcript_15305/g.44255 Transcript_15305/m.44255 type:complete len:234 (-) Transcript_15305:104-805(-)
MAATRPISVSSAAALRAELTANCETNASSERIAFPINHRNALKRNRCCRVRIMLASNLSTMATTMADVLGPQGIPILCIAVIAIDVAGRDSHNSAWPIVNAALSFALSLVAPILVMPSKANSTCAVHQCPWPDRSSRKCTSASTASNLTSTEIPAVPIATNASRVRKALSNDTWPCAKPARKDFVALRRKASPSPMVANSAKVWTMCPCKSSLKEVSKISINKSSMSSHTCLP